MDFKIFQEKINSLLDEINTDSKKVTDEATLEELDEVKQLILQFRNSMVSLKRKK